jgi:rhamnosyltransferase
MRNTILILLSTYNGEKYLNQQLDSIYNQQNVEFHILVRDDGSRDATLSILSEYQKSRGNMTILQGENIGVLKSFFALMEYAANNMSNFDYYAFSDQDDVWLNDKLYTSVTALSRSNNPYKLYYCNCIVCNDNLKQHLFSTKDTPKTTYKTALVRNNAIGCSLVFSKDLLMRSCDVSIYLGMVEEKKMFLHDSWMNILAQYLDAFIVSSAIPKIYYRQHNNNVTHATGYSFMKKVQNVLNTNNKYSNRVALLIEIEKTYITNPKKYQFLKKLLSYKKTIFHTLFWSITYPFTFLKKPIIAFEVFLLIILRKF